MKLQILATFCIIASCQDSSAPSQGPRPAATVQSEAQWIPSHDDEMLMIASRVPEFAGVFLDRDGELVIRTRTPAVAAAARYAVSDYLERRVWKGSGAAARYRNGLISRSRNAPAVFTFKQLSAFAMSALEFPEFRFLDINETQNQLLIGVAPGRSDAQLRLALRDLSIPEAAVVFEEVGDGGRTEALLTDRIRPVVAGHIIRNSVYLHCTVGFNANHWVNGVKSATQYFLTASHCDPNNMGTVVPDMEGNNTNSAADSIGKEAADPIFHNAIPNCPANHLCRRSDAAAFKYVNGATGEHASMAWPTDTGTLTYTLKKTIMGSGDVIEGSTVYKIGSKTGRHVGTVELACSIATNIPNTNKYVTCMNRSNYRSDVGDSGGAIVMTYPEGTLVSVGLHSFLDANVKRWFSSWSGISNDLGPALPGGGSICVTASC